MHYVTCTRQGRACNLQFTMCLLLVTAGEVCMLCAECMRTEHAEESYSCTMPADLVSKQDCPGGESPSFGF